MTDNLIEIRHLSKCFENIQALEDLTLNLQAGRIVGLVGPNGAGKSTLLRLIAGLYLPTAGTCSVFGTPAAKLSDAQLEQIGFVDQESHLIPWLSVKQLLHWISVHYSNWSWDAAHELINLFAIDQRRRLGSLTPGERQRVAITMAVAHQPKLLLLDEPIVALDPVARMDFTRLLIEINRKLSSTIIYSTHILSDAERSIDELLILKAGRVMRHGSLAQLKESWRSVRLQGERLGEFREKCSSEFSEFMVTDGSIVMQIPTQKLSLVQSAAQQLALQLSSEDLELEDIYRLELGRS